jgi:GTPase SAR1 family protein
MVFFNYALRKLNAKIVYYGPGLCGKTTNLQWIHDHFEGGQRGKMISLATEGDRTIFFDLLPIEIGTIRGMQVTLQLYTVPGQVHYNSTRQLVLRGADGVVFVADSQRTMHTSNLDSFKNLQENLLLQGINLEGFPLALQFNKRDLRDLISTEELNEQLNPFSVPIFDAIATEGVGVQETLEGIVKLVMRSLRERYEPVVGAGAPEKEEMPAEKPAPVTPPPPPVVPTFPVETAPPDLSSPSLSAPVPAETVSLPDPAMTTPFDEGVASAQDMSTADFSGLTPEPPSYEEAKPVATLEDDVNTGVYGDAEEELDEALENVAQFMDEPRSVLQEPEFPAEPLVPDFDLDNLGDDEREPLQAFDFPDESGESDESFDHARTDSGFEVPGISEIAIGRVEEEEPEAEVAPAPEEERYEDRIQAPSPFAPQDFVIDEADAMEPEVPAFEVATLDEPDMEPAAESPEVEDRGPFGSRPGSYVISDDGAARDPVKVVDGNWESQEVAEDVRQAFGAGENLEALASLVADANAEVVSEEALEVDLPDVELPEVEPPEEELPEVEPPSAEEGFGEVPEVVPPEAEEPVSDEEDIPETIDVVLEPAAAEAVPDVREDVFSRPPTEPIIVGEGDPFADALETPPEVVAPASIEPAVRREVDVHAEDNQLHLRLQGTGAIVESGQVRALDIEVPVPGSWVGNRRVTLQLRLTLTPAAEDENGGAVDPS